MRELRLASAVTLTLTSSFFVGCAAQTGTLAVTASGEEAAESGYPTADISFTDGWSIAIDHVFVHVETLTLARDGVALSLETEGTVVDLHDGEQTVWTLPGLTAARYPEAGYTIAPPAEDALRLGTVTADDVQAMHDDGIAFRLVGTASHPDYDDVAIDLAIPMTLVMTHCVSGTDGTDGLVVPASGTHTSQLTLHLDHLFFDSARAEEPNLRFEPWAAAAGDDGVVTLEDLAAQSLTELVGLDGEPLDDEDGTLIAYEIPTTGLTDATLRGFVLSQAETIGHFEGEGHCTYTVE